MHCGLRVDASVLAGLGGGELHGMCVVLGRGTLPCSTARGTQQCELTDAAVIETSVTAADGDTR